MRMATAPTSFFMEPTSCAIASMSFVFAVPSSCSAVSLHHGLHVELIAHPVGVGGGEPFRFLESPLLWALSIAFTLAVSLAGGCRRGRLRTRGASAHGR